MIMLPTLTFCPAWYCSPLLSSVLLCPALLYFSPYILLSSSKSLT